jgi:DNA-binding NtrC family response regulator
MNERMLQKLINLPAPLLITGETGTGKSFLAKKIFNSSRIHKDKFITAHLASLKEDLLESELFGYKKGAFTGATDAKNGYLRDVGSGTLFLDEIGELSLDAQKKLLYLLEEKKFTPIGSTQSQDFCGRIIMATNRDLKSLVRQGLFREDLYYRVAVFKLNLPSLRENQEILSDSIIDLLSKLKTVYQRPHLYLSEEARAYLLANPWKGNFRELKNTLEYAVFMSEERQIRTSDFPQNTPTLDPGPKNQEKGFIESFPCDFNQSLEIFEKMYLEAILVKNGGRVNDTARRLGMSKTTLIQKAKKHRINTLKMRADASVLAA